MDFVAFNDQCPPKIKDKKVSVTSARLENPTTAVVRLRFGKVGDAPARSKTYEMPGLIPELLSEYAPTTTRVPEMPTPDPKNE